MSQPARLAKIQAMLADDPDDAFLRYSLGMEHASLGDDAGAVKVFEDLIALKPADRETVPAYHMAGQALNRLARYEDACAMLRNGIAAARAVGDTHALGEMETLLQSIE